MLVRAGVSGLAPCAMTADDKHEEARPYEFTVRIPSGAIVFGTKNVDAGEWWLELRARNGTVLQHVPMRSDAVSDLYRQSLAAFRLEHDDLEPDFFSLATSRELLRDGHARNNPRHRQFASIFNALGHATTRPSSRVDRLLGELSETCSRFLEAEGETHGLAPRLRGRKGKAMKAAWASLSAPVQEAMEDLATALTPTLVGASSVRHQGTVVLRAHLRDACSAALHRFSRKVIDATSDSVGEVHGDPPAVRKRREAGAMRTQAQHDEFEERVVKGVVDAFDGLKDVPSIAELLRAVRMDPDDFKSVKWVIRQAYGVLMPGERADSLIRSFKIPNGTLNAAKV